MTKLLLTQKMVDNMKGNKAVGFYLMDPWDFLSLTTDKLVNEWVKQEQDETRTVEEYNEFAQAGKSILPPFLDIDRKTGKVVGHEGRHRAAALLNSHGDRFMVAITLRDNGYPVYYEYPFEDGPDRSKWLIKRYLTTEDVPPVFHGQFRPSRVSFRPKDFKPFTRADQHVASAAQNLSAYALAASRFRTLFRF